MEEKFTLFFCNIYIFLYPQISIRYDFYWHKNVYKKETIIYPSIVQISISFKPCILKFACSISSFEFLKFNVILKPPSYLGLTEISNTNSPSSRKECIITPLANNFSISWPIAKTFFSLNFISKLVTIFLH